MNLSVHDWLTNEQYIKMLSLMGQLSNLFSESEIPFIHYRVTENLFCKYLKAENLSRTDTAYDARIANIGVGIKTFQLKNNQSIEKIAEFNKLSTQLRLLHGDELAYKLAEFRNERILLANNLYNIEKPIYHIVGRSYNELILFNADYDFVNTEEIARVKDSEKSITFDDGKHKYTFNKSKSVLMKHFEVPQECVHLPIDIIKDPYLLLEQLIGNSMLLERIENRPNVILPLYSTDKNGVRKVEERSGLNQWNANGRPRDPDEVYIKIPAKIHKLQPDFFPSRDVVFKLRLPDGNVLQAKVCQDNSKALMSNPNKALGNWILRKVLRLKQRELLTIEKLDVAGFDSLILYKNEEFDYSLEVCYCRSAGFVIHQD